MSDYWLGVLTLPVVAVTSVAAWVAIKHLLALGGKAAANVALRMPRDANLHQRSRYAAVIYGAKRARFVVLGELGIGVIVGLDHERQKQAVERLDPPLSLRDLGLPDPANPAGNTTSTEAGDPS